MKGKAFKYGTGRKPTTPAFIKYMDDLILQAPYSTMPALRDDRGKINWQVSSGTGTSFFRHYNARFEWWVALADKLRLPGVGNSNDRFTIAARQVHPTGLRPCRICGEQRSIFYRYVNKNLARRWASIIGKELVQPQPPITLEDAAEKLRDDLGEARVLAILEKSLDGFGMPLKKWPDIALLAERLKLGGHRLLSPGFMANCPDRLDGFHDIAYCCRAKFDPGRSEDNLRSYANDRRAFQWWANGDWKAADALYNAAQDGTCLVCDRAVDRISPDHVGPLACGFLHRPAFSPLCKSCNSSKNRRMSLGDVENLIADEKRGERIIGWHAKTLWDLGKVQVQDDAEAVWLSHKLRALQHHFLQVLYEINEAGYPHFLVESIPYSFAFQKITLEDFDPRNLTARIVATPLVSKYAWSKARRIVRIAFEELSIYAEKVLKRKVLPIPKVESSVEKIVSALEGVAVKENGLWVRALAEPNVDLRERKIEELLRLEKVGRKEYEPARKLIQNHFDEVGAAMAKMPNKLFVVVEEI